MLRSMRAVAPRKLTTRAGSSVGGDNNDYQIRDVKISNNIFKAGKGGGVEVWGQDNQWYRNTKMTARFEFSNNLGYSLVGGVFRSPMVYIQDGIEKATIRNNTWYNNSGSAPAIMTFSSPFGGLDFRNNLVEFAVHSKLHIPNNGSGAGSFNVVTSGGNIQLVATPTSANSTVWTTQYRFI